MAMTDEERLLDMLGGSEAVPTLSSETLADCLLLASVPDVDGLYTDSVDWVPTYDFHRAAAIGWRRKASVVAADYSIKIEGRELNRAQMVENFLKMAQVEQALSQPRYFDASDALASWRV